MQKQRHHRLCQLCDSQLCHRLALVPAASHPHVIRRPRLSGTTRHKLHLRIRRQCDHTGIPTRCAGNTGHTDPKRHNHPLERENEEKTATVRLTSKSSPFTRVINVNILIYKGSNEGVAMVDGPSKIYLTGTIGKFIKGKVVEGFVRP